MITNIQLLRALAALAVVFYHSGFPINGAHTEFQGVALFFCISGFLMVYMTREERPESFLLSRVVRIVPLYWVATLAFHFWTHLGLSNPPYVWPLLWGHLLHAPRELIHWVAHNNGLNAQSAGDLAMSLLFIPYQDAAGNMRPVLGVGWSLNMEMFFYVLFALSLRINRRWAPLTVAVALVAVKQLAASMPDPLLAFYADQYTDFFILGMLCYYAWRVTPPAVCEQHRGALIVAAAATAATFVWSSLHPTLLGRLVRLGDPGKVAVYEAFPALLLMLALWLHSAGLRLQSRAWLLLGAASYSLYLVHPLVMDTLRPVGEAWPWLDTARAIPGLAFGVGLSLLLAVAVHRRVELPLTRRARRAAKSPDAGAGTASMLEARQA